MGKGQRWTLAEVEALQKRRASSSKDAPTRKPSKYKNRIKTVDGIDFASARESRRYIDLKNMQMAGLIRGLQTQQPIPCMVNGIKVCDFVADFTYYDERGDRVVEDCKGMRLPIYILKKKLVYACTGFEIHET